jgi:hypothetical protein
LSSRVGDIAGDLYTVYTDYHDERLFRPLRIILIPLCELPLVRSLKSVSCALPPNRRFTFQIFFALRAVQHPATIPISLASLRLMEEASDLFMTHVTTLLSETGDFSEELLDLRKHFDAGNITNKIVDGTTPFPEDQQSIRDGISLEFKYFACPLLFSLALLT